VVESYPKEKINFTGLRISLYRYTPEVKAELTSDRIRIHKDRLSKAVDQFRLTPASQPETSFVSVDEPLPKKFAHEASFDKVSAGSTLGDRESVTLRMVCSQTDGSKRSQP
jgi:hypothetical protein